MKYPRPLSATFRRIRADGWTPERRVTFCVNLAASSSVTFAAASVGLSRKSAYALRKRDPDFACLWDSALEAPRKSPPAKYPERNAPSVVGTVNKPGVKGNIDLARQTAETERDLFFAALQKSLPAASRGPRIAGPSCQRQQTVRR